MIATITNYIKSKLMSYLVLALVVTIYNYLPNGTPFAELAYKAVTAFGVLVLAPFFRLMIFHEAADYSESGDLLADLKAGRFTPLMAQYWFATTICYLVPIACIAGIRA